MTCTLKLDWSEARLSAVRLGLDTACIYELVRPAQVAEIQSALADISRYCGAAEAVTSGRPLEPVNVLDPLNPLTKRVLFRGEIAREAPYEGWHCVQPYTVIDLPPSYRIVPG
jgi:hypothetical protein